MGSLIYDTGALIAAENNSRRFWALHKRALQRHVSPTVPAGVIAEAWRGNSPQMARVLKGTFTAALTAASARATGQLLASTKGSVQVVDAMVVQAAASTGSAVVTSDPNDIATLASAAGVRLDIIPI